MVDIASCPRKSERARSGHLGSARADKRHESPGGSPPSAVASRDSTSMPSVPRIDWSTTGGRLLVYSPGDPTGISHLGVCDVAAGMEFTPIDVHGGLVGAARIAADASHIFVGLAERHPRFGSLWQVDCRSAAVTQILDLGERVAVSAVAASADGQSAAVGTVSGIIHVCHLARNGTSGTLHGHRGPISALQFSEDGRQVVSASTDGTIRLWDPEGRHPMRCQEGHGQPVSSVRFLPGDREIISSGIDGTIRLWDALTGEELWQAEADPFWVNSVSVSPDGRRAVSGGCVGSISFWDLPSGTRLLEFPAHAAAVSTVEFSPDGSRVASASYDGTVRLWDVASVDATFGDVSTALD